MKTLINQTNSKITLIILTTFFGLMGIIGLILHISPSEMFHWMAGFAKHHYFLVGFISLVLAMISLKFYFFDGKTTPFKSTSREIVRKRAFRRRTVLTNMRNYFRTAKINEGSDFIKREDISKLKFTPDEVLTNNKAIEERYMDIERARVLGNLYKHKVIISFMDQDSRKHTLGTIWYSDRHFVGLKGGVTLPINRICKIDF